VDGLPAWHREVGGCDRGEDLAILKTDDPRERGSGTLARRSAFAAADVGEHVVESDPTAGAWEGERRPSARLVVVFPMLATDSSRFTVAAVSG
jgi:hypothetical protein